MPRKITTKNVKVTKKASTKKTAKKKVAKPEVQLAVAQPTVPVVPVVPVQTEAEKIWEQIRYRPIEMFALPNQIVEQHCTPFPVDPNRLFLTIRSTATLPSLEVSCGKDFVVEIADRFVIVTRAQAPFVFPAQR